MQLSKRKINTLHIIDSAEFLIIQGGSKDRYVFRRLCTEYYKDSDEAICRRSQPFLK